MCSLLSCLLDVDEDAIGDEAGKICLIRSGDHRDAGYKVVPTVTKNMLSV